MSYLTREERSAIMLRSKPWTPEQDAVFRRMWEAGASINIIAVAVDKTRNSVASRRRTLGLTERGNALKARKRHPKNNNPTGLTVTRLLTARAAAPKPVPKPVPAAEPGAPLKSITDIGRAQCRWIGERPELLTLDTPLYCGAPTDGGSWCPAHRARVFVGR